MEGCCYLCGDTGVTDALRTCCQCRDLQFHAYCMRPWSQYGVPVVNWYCDLCTRTQAPPPLASSEGGQLNNILKETAGVEGRKPQKKLSKGSFNWEKKVDRGKTKYITVEEALKLPSGSSTVLNATRRSRDRVPKMGSSKLDKSPIKSKAVFPSVQDLFVGPLRQNKVQTPSNMERSEPLLQSKRSPVVETSRTTRIHSQAMAGERIVKEQTSGAQLPQNTAIKSPIKQNSAPSSDSPVIISGGNGESTTNRGTCNAENVDVAAFKPALDALWKGNFIVQFDFGKWELSHQMQAHPPMLVFRENILKLYTKMPAVLQFQSIPLENIWMEFLQQCSPTARNIGLYFFPSVEWSSSGYVTLVDQITTKNSALRTQIGSDVELLVFTSKLLPAGTQCIKKKNFLWGVFRQLKLTESAPEMHMQPPTHGSPAENEDHEMDMEIDMIGGVDIGKTEEFRKYEAERNEAYPPGFEEAYKLKFDPAA